MRISRWAAVALCGTCIAYAESPPSGPSPTEFAEQVDGLILRSEGVPKLQLVDDATFLRRVSFDIAGRPASPGQISRFEQLESADKRKEIVDLLLSSDYYSENWSRYWKDAILLRATNMRAGIIRPVFEDWMAVHLATGRGWDEIATELLTATGKVSENGATALLFAHEGEAEEIAAEASRLFLGVQIQCANCHDHPWDRWKRSQFHELVAFFPRVSVRRDPTSDRVFDYIITSVDRDPQRRPGLSRILLTRLDRNRDGVISETESKGSPIRRIFNSQIKSYVDTDADGKLSIREIMTAEPPNGNRPGRGATEHFMADLSDPASKGTRIDPVFFLHNETIRPGQADVSRRKALAELITSPDNIWFARSIVNRMWSEMTGTAFYSPVDDIGPDRTPQHEDALNVLCDGFVASGHDLKWLIRTIASTEIYQRPLNTTAEGFIRCEPTRLRSDQLYDALCQTLGTTRLPLRFTGGRRSPYDGRDSDSGRLQFASTFGFDPSTPQDDLTGSIPETLFLINSTQIQSLLRSDSAGSTVRRILLAAQSDDDAVRQLCLRALGREPTASEVSICLSYLQEAPTRDEAFEDVLWSLINSTEFLSKR